MSHEFRELRKLDQPPAGPNWVRYNFPDLDRTTNALVAFVLNIPQITYSAGMTIVRDRIVLGLDNKTALEVALRAGAPASRPYVYDFVQAFLGFDEVRMYSGKPAFSNVEERFHVSPFIKVPIRPLAVISEGGQLVPIFVCGWSENSLTDYQCRLLMTIYEDAIFSLTDFQSSPGEILFFPKEKCADGVAKRVARPWRRGDFQLLSKAELKEQVDIYLEARELAKPILLEKLFERKISKSHIVEKESSAERESPAAVFRDLFDEM